MDVKKFFDLDESAQQPSRKERAEQRAAEEARVLENAKACPFCGSHTLSITEWWDEDGEYNAIACRGCKAEAPAVSWNLRAPR